ncbi:MAG: C40 family peptidase [Spirochaetales bacterium]|nr:C40 family peptidase [Spirochaetales bacterium]
MGRTTLSLFVFTALIAGSLDAEQRYSSKSVVEINKGYVQERLVRTAMKYLGVPYVSGGKSKKGVDCSGFMYVVYLEATGKKLPLGVTELYLSLPAVKGPLLPGDLVFFDTVGGVSHVGMVIGGSRIIHAASEGPTIGVKISSLEETYYRSRYLGARRVFRYTAPVLYATLGGTRIGTKLAASLETGRPISLSVANRRKGSAAIVCRLVRKDGNAQTETRRIAIAPGKETLVSCTFEESGDWVISFTEAKAGDVMRIEVKVERAYAPPRDPSGKRASYTGFRAGS